MNYEQFIQSQIRRHERGLADIRAGRVFWCESCECWCPMDEKRPDPWGGDWPMCVECLAESGLEGSLVTERDYYESVAHSGIDPEPANVEEL